MTINYLRVLVGSNQTKFHYFKMECTSLNRKIAIFRDRTIFGFFICSPVRTNSDLKTSQTIPDDIQHYDIVLLSILLPTKRLILKPTKVSSIPEQYRLRIFLLIRISLLQCLTIPLPSEIKYLIAVLIQKDPDFIRPFLMFIREPSQHPY